MCVCLCLCVCVSTHIVCCLGQPTVMYIQYTMLLHQRISGRDDLATALRRVATAVNSSPAQKEAVDFSRTRDRLESTFLSTELISEFDFFLKHEVDSEEPSIAVSLTFCRYIEAAGVFTSLLLSPEPDRGDDHWPQTTGGQQREDV